MQNKKVALSFVSTYVCIGLLFAGLFIVHNKQNTAESTTVAISTATPISVVFPTLKHAVSIVPGIYDRDANVWNVGLHSGQFATLSEVPNTSTGNTVIYGHNNKEVFGEVKNLKLDDPLYLITQSKKVYEYEVTSIYKVNPTDTSVLEKTSQPSLTIITCSGLINEKRLIVKLKFVKLI